MKSLSLVVGIIVLSISFPVFTGDLEAFGGTGTYLSKNVSTHFYLSKQSVAYLSKNVVRAKVESCHQVKFPIETGAKLELRKCFSKSEKIPIILCVFIAMWGTAIIFVLGLIVYRVVIELLLKRKIKREKR